jgi:DNA-binding NtrC family response regulator
MASVSENDMQPILLVDDEPEILASLKGLLRREFTLFTAQSGDEALEILRGHSIHVIMTDQRMPNMTGAELLTKAKELSPDSIQIVFTGYADIKAVVDAVNNGQLYRYITKPWDPDELIQALQAAAEEYARRKRRRELFGEVKSFLDETLSSNDDLASAPCNGEFRERGENLRSQIEHEIEVYDAPA